MGVPVDGIESARVVEISWVELIDMAFINVNSWAMNIAVSCSRVEQEAVRGGTNYFPFVLNETLVMKTIQKSDKF